MKRKRLNFVVPQETADTLIRLKEATGKATLTETFKAAVTLFDVLERYRRQGSEIVIRQDGVDRMIIL